MYLVLCALTWRPMPAAACSKLCSSISAWLCVFAIIAMSSSKSASVIVFAGYLLPLFFVSSKPWNFGECIVALHFHCSQVYSYPEWKHMTGFCLWVKYSSLTLKLYENKWLMLNWVVRNRIVSSFNSVQTKDQCLIKLLVIHSYTWNDLTVSKRIINVE